MICEISVIIPVYNADKYIGRSLDCLLSQTEENIEIICVNDGSTDNTEAVLNEYAERDKRIRMLQQENTGAGAARNLGLSVAKGKYTIFLDADDVFENNMLSELLNCAKTNNADSVICLADSFSDLTGKTVPEEWSMPIKLLDGRTVFSPSEMSNCLFQLVQGWPWDKLFRTDYLKELGIAYPHLPNSHDLVFVFQALAFSSKIAIVNRTLVHRRIHNSSSISNSRARSWDSPFLAVEMVRLAFDNKGVMETFKVSFYKWALEFLLWHLNTLPSTEQKKCYLAMKHQWLPKIQFEQLPKNTYPHYQYRRLQVIRSMPYWLYNTLRSIKRTMKRKD